MNLTPLISGTAEEQRRVQQQLYEKYADLLMAKVIRYVPDPHLAMDIMHDGFIKIFNNLRFVTGGESGLTAWMSRIMINEALQYHRRNKKILFVSHSENEAVLEKHLDPEIFQSLEAEEIQKKIDRLSDVLRLTFMLYYIDGYKHREIAQLLDITEQVSRTRLNRAKAQLRTFFLVTETERHAK